MAEMIEICGAWKKQGRSASYYGGQVKETITIPAGSYVSIFQNKDATEENRKPALRVLFSAPDGQQPTRQAGGGRADDLDQEIPFSPCTEV